MGARAPVCRPISTFRSVVLVVLALKLSSTRTTGGEPAGPLTARPRTPEHRTLRMRFLNGRELWFGSFIVVPLIGYGREAKAATSDPTFSRRLAVASSGER